MSRGFKILAIVFLVFFLAIFIPGSGALGDTIFALLFGWIRFTGKVLPKVTVNPAGVGMALGCVALAAVLGHRLCAWLWRETGHAEPWRGRWTAAGLSAVVVLFAAGMAFTGVAHQVGWLMRSPKPLWINTGANERSPSAGLKTIASAQADFRGNDRDGDRIQNFWRADIAGLYSLKPPESEEMIKLIAVSVAAADAKPSTPIDFAAPTPYMGYWYRALRFKDETEPDPNRFAAIAYPDSPSAGLYMFAISHANTLFRKAVGKDPIPEVYPEDPLKEGWTKLD